MSSLGKPLFALNAVFMFSGVKNTIVVDGVEAIDCGHAVTPCGWCGQTKQKNPYVLLKRNGRRLFCSESCLLEFRRETCFECGSPLSLSPLCFPRHSSLQKFCSQDCIEKFKPVESSSSSVLTTMENSLSSPDAKLKSCATVSGSALVLNSNPSSFSWEEYLVETNSIAAPGKCFKQVNYITFTLEYLII